MLNPIAGLYSYDPDQAVLPYRADLAELDFLVLDDASAMSAIEEACELQPRTLSERQIDDLMDFLWALTDPQSVDLRVDVPASVPSGLPLAE
jgi:cytochrome c peroxidase